MFYDRTHWLWKVPCKKKLSLVDKIVIPWSCFHWSVFKNLRYSNIIFRHIKARLQVFKYSPVFKSTIHRKANYICRPLTRSGSKSSSAIMCFVNKLCQNNNESHKANLTISMRMRSGRKLKYLFLKIKYLLQRVKE